MHRLNRPLSVRIPADEFGSFVDVDLESFFCAVASNDWRLTKRLKTLQTNAVGRRRCGRRNADGVITVERQHRDTSPLGYLPLLVTIGPALEESARFERQFSFFWDLICRILPQSSQSFGKPDARREPGRITAIHGVDRRPNSNAGFCKHSAGVKRYYSPRSKKIRVSATSCRRCCVRNS